MEGVKNTVWIRILRLLYIAIKVYIKVSKYLDETASVARCFIQKASEGFLIKKNPTFFQISPTRVSPFRDGVFLKA